MRKSQVLPKICAFVLFLVIAVIISAPVSSVMFNKILGGGTLDFNEVNPVDLRDNRPIEGNLYYIAGCTGSDGDDSGFTLKKGDYYYLVFIGGKSFDKDNPAKLIVIETSGSSDIYETFNNLWRESANGASHDGIKISGVVRSNSSAEESAIEKIKENTDLGDIEAVTYYIDCKKPVSQMSTRFYISLIFYAGTIISLLLVIQAVKKNRRIAQEMKSGNKNDDGTDAMFGDSERDLDEMPQRQGQSYEPSFRDSQYQSGGYDSGADMYTGSQNQSEDEYDGFFGG